MKTKTHIKTQIKIGLLCSLIFLSFVACEKKEGAAVNDPPQTPAATPQPTPSLSPSPGMPTGPCVNIFYDTTTDVTYKNLGRTYGLMVANLLGHFPQYQQVLGPIDLYRKGDLNACHASFYIGSNFAKPLPPDFIEDYKTTERQVVLVGYNFWQLGADFEAAFGFSAVVGDFSFTTLDTTTTSIDGKPGYFRDILYKGETFYKFSTWQTPQPPEGPKLIAAFEMTRFLKQTSPAASEVLAQARHSTTGEILPWVLKAKNKFYVAEIPLSFIHEADRYFVFADLMFDFLNEPARHNSKPAVLRLEDVNALMEENWLDAAIGIVKQQAVIPHLSLVPVFRDPFHVNTEPDSPVEIPMAQAPAFADRIRKYTGDGAVMIWHGVTHQYNELKNPFTGATGDDYEFWNSVTNSPVAEDSVSYVLAKLDKGFESMKVAGVAPKIWVTPHYHASALDNVIFGDIFSWIVGRGVYTDFKMSGHPKPDAPDTAVPLHFDPLKADGNSGNRSAYFAALAVQATADFQEFGQLFPYEIYGNIYGQRVVPENLGNVQPQLNNQVVNTRNVARILEDAKRNLVLRDVWASVFYHPFLLDPALNDENKNNPPQTDLERLVAGLKGLGYSFVNLNTYAAENVIPKGKIRIELEEIRH